MHKKILLVVMGILMVLAGLTARGLNIAHWEETDWDVSSYDPVVPILSIAGALCFTGIVFLTAKSNIWMWFGALSWLFFGVVLAWAMYCM